MTGGLTRAEMFKVLDSTASQSVSHNTHIHTAHINNLKRLLAHPSSVDHQFFSLSLFLSLPFHPHAHNPIHITSHHITLRRNPESPGTPLFTTTLDPEAWRHLAQPPSLSVAGIFKRLLLETQGPLVRIRIHLRRNRYHGALSLSRANGDFGRMGTASYLFA